MPAGTFVRRGLALPLQNVEYIDNGDLRPGWLSDDGTVVYSWGKTGLYTSTDDGSNYTLRHTFPREVFGVREVFPPAGKELLVSLEKQQGFYAGLWKSSGWHTNPATATWREVLSPSGQTPNTAGLPDGTWPIEAGTSGDRSNYFNSQFSLRVGPGALVIMTEYGHQGGVGIPGARYVFLSQDYGDTWIKVFDLGYHAGTVTAGGPILPPDGVPGEHVHGACVDPYWQIAGRPRLWVTCGDHGMHTEYSDDLGATWTPIPGCIAQYGGNGLQPGATQCATVWPYPDRVCLGTDGSKDGIMKIDRSGGPTAPLVDVAHAVLSPSSALRYISGQTFARDQHLYDGTYSPKFPVLWTFYAGSPTIAVASKCVISDPFGNRFNESWVDSQLKVQSYGMHTALGPTAKGKFLASIEADGRAAGSNWTFLRADMPTIL